MSVDATTVALISVPIFLYLLYWLAYGRFKSTKLPGPQITPFLGNLGDLKRHNYNLHLQLNEYYKRYGNMFEFFYHGEPVIVVGEENIVKQILGKHFQKFQNRKFFVDVPWPCVDMVTMLKDSKWKYIRALLTPFFTPLSLQNMSPLISKAADTYVHKLDDVMKTDKIFDAVRYSKGFVMEVLLSMLFSLDCPNQSELNNTLVELTANFTEQPKWVNIIASLPFGQRLVKYIPAAGKKQLQPFIDTALGIVASRRKEDNGKQKDVLEALFNVQKAGPDAAGNVLTDTDILAQGILILTAVHVSTSATLALALYYIAKHRHIQEKVHAEIDALATEEGFPTYEHANKGLQYLERIVDETLRLNPNAHILMRECNEACTIDGMKFDKGTNVFIPVYDMHRDSTYWDDPEKFNPDRFSDGDIKKGVTYIPFGFGQRKCFGFRLVFIEVKNAIAKILRRYTISLKDDHEPTLSSFFSVQVMSTIDQPIMLNLQKRDD